MASSQIVIARYNEDVKWAADLPAIIYNKGMPLEAPLMRLQRCLPNLGRESQTYLHHIVHCWNELADVTLFTQGRLDDHLPAGMRVEHLLNQPADMTVAKIIRIREWGPQGRFPFSPGGPTWSPDATLKRSDLSLVDWFRVHFSLDIDGLGYLIFSPGAIFAVKKECIRRRPLEFYSRLLDAVSHDIDPEEGHYMERSWLYIFGFGVTQVHSLT